jgi:hypothetical protein
MAMCQMDQRWLAPDLRKPPETNTGATVCTWGIAFAIRDKEGQTKAIGSHFKENHNLEEEHPPRIENHVTSPHGKSDNKQEGQSNGVAPNITRKEHMGKVASIPHHHPLAYGSLEMTRDTRMPVRSNRQFIAQEWLGKQEWQKKACQDKSNVHSDKLQMQMLPLEMKTQGFQDMGISIIGRLPTVRPGLMTDDHAKEGTLLSNREIIKALEIAASLQEQAHSLVNDILRILTSKELISKIGIKWGHKSKSQCKDTSQIASKTHKMHPRSTNMSLPFGEVIRHHHIKALQKYLRRDSNHQDDLIVAPNRPEWC